MKRLFLIRHAKSSWNDPGATDFERKLNTRGKRDAPFMARQLASRTEAPDILIASPASRARKTAEIMADGVGYARKRIRFDEQVYDAGSQDLLRIVRSLDDEYRSAFVVGHNYAITDFAERLTGETLNNIPTSGIVAVDCGVDQWHRLAHGNCRLLFFDYPKNHAELR